MNAFTNIILFFIVLFLYIHIVHQFKRSEDLEIYEMDYSTNQHLQEVCDIKQPVLFQYQTVYPEFFEKINEETIRQQNYPYDVKVKDIQDYWKNEMTVDPLLLPFQSAQTLIESDTKSNYFSENNHEFIEESGIIMQFQENNDYLKPNFTIQTKYDLQFASKDCITPLQYHTNYRYFICVNSGKIRIKMTPWKSKKYLHIIKDYDNYEFRSPINVWKPQSEYMNDMEKLKFLEFDILAGNVLYIPAYWFYSIQYCDSKTFITGFTYISIMNSIVNIPNYTLYFLQQQNIQKKITKTVTFEDETNTKEENE